MPGAVEGDARVLDVHPLQRGREAVGVALPPGLTVGDDVDPGPLHVSDGEQGGVVLRPLEQLWGDSPDLGGAGPRREAVAEQRAVDQPVRLGVAADHGRRQQGHDELAQRGLGYMAR